MAPKNPNPDDVLKTFIARAPASRYTFDSERGAPESSICREEGSNLSRECIVLQMQSKRLFEAMQNLGFFCALPMDPNRTYMECTPIPK
ncbi:hypothetical protein C8F04DRAFT_1390048 [Mycena alexandri]|uniref:Uncharacterized protein n=1 Tax=Mycena alexandri TaxID=1745969 RepID=A0AAD6TG08_9AGAR|nr:hypothetical protein C8F04DRAFT_1390048 [Mycena alexandri]